MTNPMAGGVHMWMEDGFVWTIVEGYGLASVAPA